MSKPPKNSIMAQRINRRSFLGYAGSMSLYGLTSSPVAALFSTILGGESQKAWADSLGIQPRSFVQILEGGAPARWMFDSFLTPYSSAGFVGNPMLGTQFRNVGGRYIGVDYVTTQMRGIQVPTMWTHDLPAPGNGYRPMANLLDNLLCIQGITTRNAGHENSQLWHWLPPGGSQSTSAFSADASNTPFPALQAGADSYVFRSLASKSALSVNSYGNMLTNLLDPFKVGGSAQFKVNRSTIRQAYEGLLPSLDELARQGHPGAEALTLNRDSALDLMETNFSNLGTEWTSLQSKYQSLITRAIFDPSKPLAGVNDLPIGEGGSGLRALYQLDDNSALDLHLSTDLRSAVDSRTNVNRLAERFAFTEYVLRNKLSASIAFSVGSIGPFIRQSDGALMDSMGNDQHFSGLYPSTYFNILRHRAIAACLMELIEQLKAASLFNNTVISLSGEFNRNPSADMLGSDHGWTGKSVSLYSGAFSGPLIVGNLSVDTDTSHPGSWGAGGQVVQLGRQLTLVDQAVTIAHVLGVPPPFTSTNPLVTLGSGGLISNVGTTRIV